MTITTISAREFDQDTSGAMNAARHGPIFITDNGRPSHVLLTIDDYRKLTQSAATITDLLATPV